MYIGLFNAFVNIPTSKKRSLNIKPYHFWIYITGFESRFNLQQIRKRNITDILFISKNSVDAQLPVFSQATDRLTCNFSCPYGSRNVLHTIKRFLELAYDHMPINLCEVTFGNISVTSLLLSRLKEDKTPCFSICQVIFCTMDRMGAVK